jgi:hypothetical protein
MEPISTIAVVFAGAQAAVEGVKKGIALGKEIRDVYGELSSFFHAQGKIESAYQKEEFTKIVAPKKGESKRSATQRALDIVFIRREMYKMEVELREMLIYQFKDTGLYDEMCVERDKIIAAERAEVEAEQRRINELILEEKRRLREIAKKRKARIDLVLSTIAIALSTFLGISIIYGVWWMFQQGGKL